MMKSETNEALTIAAVVFIVGGGIALALSLGIGGINDLFYGVLGSSIASFFVTWRKLRE